MSWRLPPLLLYWLHLLSTKHSTHASQVYNTTNKTVTGIGGTLLTSQAAIACIKFLFFHSSSALYILQGLIQSDTDKAIPCLCPHTHIHLWVFKSPMNPVNLTYMFLGCGRMEGTSPQKNTMICTYQFKYLTYKKQFSLNQT